MMDQRTYFAEVILPLPLPGTFTYRIPVALQYDVIPGIRVVVQFGKQKIYTGLVLSIHENAPQKYAAKYVLSVLDDVKPLPETYLQFLSWVASYYMCNPGDVLQAALPSALKLASETRLVLNPSWDKNYDLLNEKEHLIADALSIQDVISINDAARIVDQIKVVPLIRSLIVKNVVVLEEELHEKYKPLSDIFVSLHPQYYSDESINELFTKVGKRSEKQSDLLMVYLSNCQGFEEIRRKTLLSKSKAESVQLNTLIKKGIFRAQERLVSRFEDKGNNFELPILSEAQQKSLEAILKNQEIHVVNLLHGVTSSGKTEIYIHLIDSVLKSGGQVLYLLPEIALTTQIIQRIRKFFGSRAGVYHSKYNDQERAEVWLRCSGNGGLDFPAIDLVLGARSSLFLPFTNLKLIIVDEEHDASYKQFDPAPRYHARDSAIYLAHLCGAQVILGSATPSIESYYNASHQKYGLIKLSERFGGVMLPEIQVADVKEERLRKNMKSHFAPLLFDQITAALGRGEQIILFQNRRGFAPRLECERCGYVPECVQCDVSLVYHKGINKLKCHYCGYTDEFPSVCPQCSSPAMRLQGFGTEKIEDELSIMFPKARIGRMDYDSTRSKYAYQNIISDFEDREIDILVGTQMVTKGLDFDNVGLVGVVNADQMISFPDFRSFERAYQMLAQVSGRAGRKSKRGLVVVQTTHPYHEAIRNVIDNDYDAMYNSQIIDRNSHKYPPFTRLIRIELKQKDRVLLASGADVFASELRKRFGSAVLGPEFPLVMRVQNYYIMQLLIKIPRGSVLQEVKNSIIGASDVITRSEKYRSIRIVYDVDPQ
ncbi:MAG: primosomal protein N' [Bacteroidales bacterium]|nr:primosomal protein N' [Bacteroidales bacterium]